MRKFSYLLPTFIALIILSGVALVLYPGECLAGPYPNSSILVETDWLAAHLQDTNLRIVDMQESREIYLQGHIPGAVYVDWNEVRSAVTGVSREVRLWPGASEPEKITEYCASWRAEAGKLDVELIEMIIRDAGIGNDTMVVVYDNSGGLYAAHFFWALGMLGHNKVALLNGGLTKWKGENRPLVKDMPWVRTGPFRSTVKPEAVTDAAWILSKLQNPRVVFLDARIKEEYIGTAGPAKRGGHIPGAVHLEWNNAIDPTTKTFKTQEELKKLLEGAGITKDKTVVPYCHAGIRSAHTYFVLRLMGYDKIYLYYPSWNEWGNKDTLPVEK